MLSIEEHAAGLREEVGIRFYQTMPPLSADEFESLKQSIRTDGVTVPVIVDEAGNIIDGHHRAMVCRELGIDYPSRTVEGLSEQEKLAMSVSLNINRRQLTREQKRLIIAQQLRTAPEKSNREQARQLGVDHKTIAAVRDELQATGEIPQLAKTVGADGKERPAQRRDPAPLDPPMVVDEATGEVLEDMPTDTAKTLRTTEQWVSIAERAAGYRSMDEAHVALAPDTNREWFRVTMRNHGVKFMDPRKIAKLTDQANGIVERMGDNILGHVETAIGALDVAALDLVDPLVAERTLVQLDTAAKAIRNTLIKQLNGITQ